MSIPRKRGKVKKKLSAAKKVGKKKAKVKAKARKRTKKRPLSAGTKPKKQKVRPKSATPKRSKKPTRKSKKRSAKRSGIRRTPPIQTGPKKAVRRKKKGVSVRIDNLAALAAFLTSPEVAKQIEEDIIDKGLASLTKGMVQTPESYMMGQLIIARQIGNLDQRAYELAAEFGWSIQDVYELYHSPETALES